MPSDAGEEDLVEKSIPARKEKGFLDRKIAGFSVLHGLLVGIVCLAFALRARGIDWPRFHPDEHPIASWIARGEPNRVYPGGMFTLIRPFRFVWEKNSELRRRVSVFLGSDTASTSAHVDYILMGRVFNAIIGALTCLFVFGAGHTISGSKPAGLIGATLMAFAPHHVEHCHYAESDIAMLFALSIALWSWAKFIATKRQAWFIAAGIACGFAAGAKFTLGILLVPWLLFCAVDGLRRDQARRGRACALTILAGLTLLFAGLAIATPQIFRFGKFMEGMASEKTRVYQETALNMGMMAGDSGLRMASHLHALVRYARGLGPGWLALWLAGMPIMLFRPYRKHWIPVLLIPLVYAYYWIAVAPWVRSQEFLNFLPFAAIVAPIPVALAWRHSHRPARMALTLTIIVALGGVGMRGVRVSSVYGWLDSRLLATRWLDRHKPDDAVFGIERYAIVTPDAPVYSVDMVARAGLSRLREGGFDYIVSSGATGHRGMHHPATGRLYPHYAARRQEFLENTLHLRTWGYLPPRETQPLFSAWNIQLYDLHRTPFARSVPFVLPQPALVSRMPYETFYPRGRHLGGATALRINENGIVCAISAEQELRDPVYAILYTRERPADIRVRGFGKSTLVRLDPYDVAVLPLKRSWLSLRCGHVERLSVKRRPVKNVLYIPCYLRIAFSEDEAHRIVEDLGYAETAAPPVSPETLNAAQRLTETDDARIGYHGIGFPSVDRFAQMAMCPAADEHVFRRPLQPDEESANEHNVFAAVFDTQFKRIAAPFTIHFDLRVETTDPPAAAMGGTVTTLRFMEEHSGTTLGTATHGGSGKKWAPLVMEVPAGIPGPFKMRIESPEPRVATIRNVRMAWRTRDILAEEYNRLATRAATEFIKQSRGAETIAVLNGIDTRPGDAWHVARFRLRFEAESLMAGPDSEALRASARDLLAVAPGHADALNALAEAGCAASQAKAKRLALPDTPMRIEFEPFVVLRNVSWDEGGQSVTALVEAKRDHVPPLALRLHEKRGGRWRRRNKAPISERRSIAKGERFLVTVPAGATMTRRTAKRFALAIESDVRYIPGSLRVKGRNADPIPLTELATNSAVHTDGDGKNDP